MKKTISLFLISFALVAQADFVYRVGNSFLTTADMDGDGRADLVLVDGSNVTVRVGYQLSDATLSWSAPRSLRLDEITDIACGNFRNKTMDTLAVCSPALNRFTFFELATASQPPVPVAAYGQGIGPEALVATDLSSGSYKDLLAVSSMNGLSKYMVERLQSTGQELVSEGKDEVGSVWRHMNEVEYESGKTGVALIDLNSGGKLRIYDPDEKGLNHIGSLSILGATNAAYVSFISEKYNTAQFVVWNDGGESIQTFAWNGSAFTSLASYDLDNPIESIFVVGADQLAVVFKNGKGASLYSYNGSNAPKKIQDFSISSFKNAVGFLSLGSDDIVMLSSFSGDLSGAVTVDQLTASGDGYVSVGTEILPSFGKSPRSANIMTFEGEPFVDNTPRRLQVLRAGDWVSDSKLTAVIQATVETDRSIEQGLGDAEMVELGATHASARYALQSQIHDAISMYSFDEARGDEVAVVMLMPDPGLYGTGIEVSFSVEPSGSIYYRTDLSNDWNLYTAPFALFADTDVQYFADTSNGRSVIRTAEYRFTESPSNLDSDGDGIPDYVELANGLDPENSGLDSDGDGYSDLDELLEGSNPTTTNSIPANSNRVERSVIYNQGVYANPYDGVVTNYARPFEGTQYWLYSPDGAQHGYAKTKTNEYFAVFEGVPLSMDPPFVTIISEPRYNLRDVSVIGTNNQHGVEVLGVVLLPTTTESEVVYEYQYGELYSEAANWLAAARSLYDNQTRIYRVETLNEKDVVAGLLIERKLADLLLDRGVISNGWKTLFKGRSADATMSGLSASDLQGLEVKGSGGEPAYHIPTLIEELISAPQNQLQYLAQDLYAICSVLGRSTNNIGKYPLPVDVLRKFIYDGTLQSNYLAVTTRTTAQLNYAYTEVAQALAQVTARSSATFTLAVRTNSFDAAYPVLYTSDGTAKSLYTDSGNPYKFPVTFTLQAGATLGVEAFTDVAWNDCPGTDPLEIISISLTAVPTATGADANGNLIPDDYENIFLVGSGGSPTSDLDGDEYSDLQEYLDGTDPNNASSHGTEGGLDMSPPIVELNIDASDLTIDWPAKYASDFVFVIQYTDELGEEFIDEQELARGDLSASIDSTKSDARFYRVIMRTR